MYNAGNGWELGRGRVGGWNKRGEEEKGGISNAASPRVSRIVAQFAARRAHETPFHTLINNTWNQDVTYEGVSKQEYGAGLSDLRNNEHSLSYMYPSILFN